MASDFDLTGQVYEGLREFLAFAGIHEDPDRKSGHPCQAVSLCTVYHYPDKHHTD